MKRIFCLYVFILLCIQQGFTQTTVTLSIISDYDSPVPSVGAHIYESGDFVDAYVSNSEVSGAPGIRYICTGYSGTGDSEISSGGTHTSLGFNIDTTSTLAWLWGTQCHLSWNTAPLNSGVVTLDDEVTDPSDWYTSGTIFSIKAIPATGYKFDSWSGDACGNSAVISVKMDSPKNITANFSALPQYNLNVISEHGTPHPSPGDHLYYEGEEITASVAIDFVTSGSVGWEVAGWIGSGSVPSDGDDSSVTFTIDQDSTITWLWNIMYMLQASVYPLNCGEVEPDLSWHDSDTTASVTAIPSPGYVFTGWDLNNDFSPDIADNPINLFMDSPKEIKAVFSFGGNVELTIVSDYGNPEPAAGMHTYLINETVSAHVNTPENISPGVRMKCTGYSGEGDSEVSAGGTTPAVNFIIDTDTTITWNWTPEYLVSANVQPANAGIINGAGWYQSGDTVSLTPSPNPGYGFLGWDINNDGNIENNNTLYLINIDDEPVSITAIFVSLVKLNVISEHGTPHPSNGIHEYFPGAQINAYVPSPANGGADGIKYNCIGYSGEGDTEITSGGGTNSLTFHIDTDSTLTWHWGKMYRLLTVAEPDTAGTVIPYGGYYPENEEVLLTSSVNPGWRFDGWDLNGDSIIDEDTTTVKVIMDAPKNIKALFSPLVPTYALYIRSQYGNPRPSAGKHIYTEHSQVSASVSSPVPGEPGIRYTCIGFSGEGDSDIEEGGSKLSVTFNIDEDSTITWQWMAEYKLRAIAYPAVGGYVIPHGETWYEENEDTELECIANYEYTFTGWDTNGDNTPDITDNPVEITMDSPKSYTAILTIPSNIIQVYDFEDGAENWNASGTITGFDKPSVSSSGGSLGLNPNGSASAFGFWGSPEIPLAANTAYKATYNISSDNFNSDTVPQIRLRANLESMARAWYRSVESYNSASPTTIAQNYEMIIDPALTAQENIILSLDLISINPNDNTHTWIYLNGLSLESVNITPDSTIANFDFSTGNSFNWQFSGKIGPFDQLNYGSSSSGLSLSASGSSSAFGFWDYPNLQLDKEKTYRAEFTLSSNQADSNTVPQFRLRANDPYTWNGWFTTIDSIDGKAPATTPKTYDLIINPMSLGEDRNFDLAFDLISISAADNASATLYLHSVKVEEVEIAPKTK